jgi:hypothetical protein
VPRRRPTLLPKPCCASRFLSWPRRSDAPEHCGRVRRIRGCRLAVIALSTQPAACQTCTSQTPRCTSSTTVALLGTQAWMRQTGLDGSRSARPVPVDYVGPRRCASGRSRWAGCGRRGAANRSGDLDAAGLGAALWAGALGAYIGWPSALQHGRRRQAAADAAAHRVRDVHSDCRDAGHIRHLRAA